MTIRAASLRACALLACAALAAPAAAAPPSHRGGGGGGGGKHTTAGAHQQRAKHPNRPTHPHGAAKHRKPGAARTGLHRHHSHLPVSVAAPPPVKPPKPVPVETAKTRALWHAPAPQAAAPRRSGRGHVAPTWLVAVPAGALALLAAGGLVRLVRRGRGPASATG